MEEQERIDAAEPLEVVPPENPTQKSLLPILCVCIGQAIWGFSYLFTRVALQYAQPGVLLSIRFLGAFLLMNLMLLSGRQKLSLRGKNLKPLILLGIAEPMYFYFESYGILYTNATFAGVVLAVAPVVAILFAAVFLKEYPTKRQMIFSLLPIAGVIMITVSGSKLGIIKPIGVIFLLCTCLTAAAYRILNRSSAKEFSAFERTYVILLASSFAFTISALISVKGDLNAYLAPLAEPGFLLPLLALTILCSIGANMLVNYAAGKLSVTKLSIFGTVSTICSMFAGVIFLNELITPVSFAGSVLILVGIWQVTRQKEKLPNE